MDYLNLVDPDAQHPLVAGVRMVADDQVPDFELILPNGTFYIFSNYKRFSSRFTFCNTF